MTGPAIDTDVLVRFLTADDPAKQAAARTLFDRVAAGDVTISAPETVIADAVYVLASRHLDRLSPGADRRDVDDAVRPPHFRVRHRRNVLDALSADATTNLDFGDAVVVTATRLSSSRERCSDDWAIDRIAGITRRAP